MNGIKLNICKNVLILDGVEQFDQAEELKKYALKDTMKAAFYYRLMLF